MFGWGAESLPGVLLALRAMVNAERRINCGGSKNGVRVLKTWWARTESHGAKSDYICLLLVFGWIRSSTWYPEVGPRDAATRTDRIRC
jgi:hypothetical protein